MYKISEIEKQKVLKYLKESLEEEYNKKVKPFKLIGIKMLQDGSLNTTVYFKFSKKEEHEECFYISYELFYKIIKLYSL